MLSGHCRAFTGTDSRIRKHTTLSSLLLVLNLHQQVIIVHVGLKFVIGLCHQHIGMTRILWNIFGKYQHFYKSSANTRNYITKLEAQCAQNSAQLGSLSLCRWPLLPCDAT